jgi:hypothetical protein
MVEAALDAQANSAGSSRPYAASWSTYTDLRGRNQFRNLYWDKYKDLIGRPAKLVGIEREDLWPSGKPSRELRCNIWRFLSANSDADAIADMIRAAFRIAPVWRVLTPPRLDLPHDNDGHELVELIWDH